MNLDKLNLSELVLLAQDNEPEAHRGQGREALIAIIMGKEVTLPTRQVNLVRLRVMSYISDHWKQVNTLLSCPARSGDPRACFQCPDLQVVECALENKKIFGFGKEDNDGTA